MFFMHIFAVKNIFLNNIDILDPPLTKRSFKNNCFTTIFILKYINYKFIILFTNVVDNCYLWCPNDSALIVQQALILDPDALMV